MFSTFLFSFQCDSEFEGLYHLPVEQSFDQSPPIKWAKRGTITIRSISNNLAQFIQAGPLTVDEVNNLMVSWCFQYVKKSFLVPHFN